MFRRTANGVGRGEQMKNEQRAVPHLNWAWGIAGLEACKVKSAETHPIKPFRFAYMMTAYSVFEQFSPV